MGIHLKSKDTYSICKSWKLFRRTIIFFNKDITQNVPNFTLEPKAGIDKDLNKNPRDGFKDSQVMLSVGTPEKASLC